MVAAMGVALISSASATPYPHEPIDAIDVGAAIADSENSTITVTVTLKLRDADGMQRLIESVSTPGTPQYRQFLTPEQFRARFGPTADSIAALRQHFQALGLTVTQSAAAQLHVTGSAVAIEKAFAVQLHSYEVAATDSAPAYRFRAPVGAPQLPATISGAVQAVFGLDTRPRFTPHLRQSPHLPKGLANTPKTPDLPGLWTVVDFSQYYDVDALYATGLTGQGRTLGIVTLANFTPSDAFGYWAALGLNVNANRLTIVNVDGGPGAPSDESGSPETTLDVQQSGGIAPRANIVVYQAPNNSQGFIDAFAVAIDSNRADTVSTSWGLWEFFDSADPFGNGPVTDPTNGQQTTILQAFSDLLAQAALQGQSMFAASGDNGAFDSTGPLPLNQFNPVLSIDDPAAQPLMTAAGGTTLPGKQLFNNGSQVTIGQEQGWGWDYLIPVCKSLGFDPVSCGIFPAGSGGGVSVYFPRPFYQQGIAGMSDTIAGQTLFDLSQSPPAVIVQLPAGFAGRNIPDLSFNADPETGYIIPYTSNHSGFQVLEFIGGTSFVAPQLNGVTALYVQALNHRVGLFNGPLYTVARSPKAYNGVRPPLRDIRQGDNWYWNAGKGYDQVTGLGVPDVAALLGAFAELGH
jgi:kumamolisin